MSHYPRLCVKTADNSTREVVLLAKNNKKINPFRRLERIVQKMNSWPRSEASRATVKFEFLKANVL